MSEEETRENNFPVLRRRVLPGEEAVTIRPLGGRYHGHYEDESAARQSVTLADILDIIWRRKRLFLGVLLFILVAAAIYMFTQIPIYQTRTTLEVVGESTKLDALKTAPFSEQSFTSQYKTQIRLLRGRSLAEEVVNRLSLEDSPDFKVKQDGIFQKALAKFKSFTKGFAFTASPPQDPEVVAEQKKFQAIEALLGRISVTAFEGSRLIEVALETMNPSIGKQILKTHIDLFLEKNLEIQREALKEARDWLLKESALAEKAVRASRVAMIDFSREHGIVSLEGEGNHVLGWFNKTADRLVKSKQASMQYEAHNRSSGGALPRDLSNEYLHKFRTDLALLESEYEQNKEVYSPNYPKMMLSQRKIQYLQKKIREIERTAMTTALSDAKNEEDMLQDTFEKAKEEAINVNSLGIQYSILKRELEASEDLLRSLLKKSKEIELQYGTVVNDLRVRDPPSMPFAPVKPKKQLFLIGSALFGLFAATLVVVYVDRKDPRLHGPEDVERQLGLESLGMLPNLSKVRHGIGQAGLDPAKEFIACAEPMSVMSEAARSIATSIALMTSFSETSIAVCSATASEGKTLLSISLASVVGSEGRKVLVIEADLRRPRIGKLFGEEDSGAGLGDLLADESMNVQDVVRPSNLPGFHYMTAGSQPVAHPLALLKSERTARIIEECKENFEWVILDCPPVIGLSDVQVIAPMVDGIVVVARENHTPVHALKLVQNSVALARGRLLGVVINMATRWPSGYPAYFYHNRSEKNKLWNFLGKFG